MKERWGEFIVDNEKRGHGDRYSAGRLTIYDCGRRLGVAASRQIESIKKRSPKLVKKKAPGEKNFFRQERWHRAGQKK